MVSARAYAVLVAAAVRSAYGLDVWFFNNHTAPLELYWDSGVDGEPLVSVGVLESGANLTQSTRAGHVFAYLDGRGDWQRQRVEATTAHVVLLGGRGRDALDVVFVNELGYPAELYWEPNDGVAARVPVGRIEPGGGAQTQLTHAGTVFSYDDRAGERRTVAVGRENAFVVLAPPVVTVSCEVDAPVHRIDFEIVPEWAPRGAARFLELVRADFFDGVASRSGAGESGGT